MRKKIRVYKDRRKKKAIFFAVSFILCMLMAGAAWAQGDVHHFGILSETYVYPDGLRLDVDSKLQWWNNIATNDDFNDKREGKRSLRGYALIKNVWFGFGIIWDPDNDNQPEQKDMSAYANGSICFWMKTQTPLKIGIKDHNSESWVWLDQIPSDNQWRFAAVPMSGFTGIDFSKITQLFMVSQTTLPTADMRTFHFDNVRWTSAQVGPLDHIIISPSPWTMHKNLPKNFLAMGYDANNHIHDIYPSWSKSGVSGSFIDNEGTIAIFKPTATTASGSITATAEGFSKSASINVKDEVWNDFFNIFIDQGLYGSLGAYDSDDGDADGDGQENNSINLDTVTDVHPPGHEKSLKATYSIKSTGWAGLFFQEGELTDKTSYRNLSHYLRYGYLNFWVKTPVDLEISARSINVTAGNERSKILLSEYNIPADNNWHEVYISLGDFRNLDTRFQLSQSKIFINAAVIGEVVGGDSSDKFYLSDIRYVRRKETTPSLSVTIKKRSDNQTEPSGQISWSTAQLGGGWEIADQYLEIDYDTVDPSWGAQIFTDNLGTGASPKYGGDPKKSLHQQPGGLIGASDGLLTCPMAWMALDDINQNVPVPAEKANEHPPGHPDRRIYFESDWGTTDPKGEWSWFKDISSTKWDDKDGDLELDVDGNFGDPGYEIVADFSSTGDEHSTFISPVGISTGWGDVEKDERVYILNPEPPIIIYMAAKFQVARSLQVYKTNTILLELYHY